MFHNSRELKEVLDTEYTLSIRNSDALTMGLQPSTPEIKVTDGQANLSGCVDISHSDVSESQRVKMDHPDSNG